MTRVSIRTYAGAAAVLGTALALAVSVAPAEAQAACGASYTVRSGDSLLGIAELCGVTLPALLAANPSVRDQQDIEAGDGLRIPPSDAPQPSPIEACGASYRIRTGDTLAEIAEKCGLTVPLLVAANGPLPEPLGIHAGERIAIPDLPMDAVRDTETVAFGPARASEEPASAAAQPAAGTPASGSVERPARAPELVRAAGVLEAADGCTRLRTDDGAVYGLIGRTGPAFGSGDRVVVLGVPADGAAPACGAGTVLEVRILYRPRPR